jgi:uncharacterized protein (DUF2267 family)
MKDDELISAIRKNSDLDDPDEVVRAAHATLSVLGKRLAGGEPLDLGSQLPTTFARELAVEGKGERFSVNDFYDRVAREEGTTKEDARRHARAVMAGVRSAVDPNEWQDMVSQLPDDYADLVFTGPVH